MPHAPAHALHARPAPSGGMGVYAARDLTVGEPVVQMRGLVLAREQVDWERHWSMQIGPDEFLCNDADHPHLDHFLNHSCDPNLAFVRGGLPRLSPWLHARRSIRAGEELCWDYSTSEDDPAWSMPCRCGAPTCRGLVTGYSRLSPAQQQALRPATLHYLLTRYP